MHDHHPHRGACRGALGSRDGVRLMQYVRHLPSSVRNYAGRNVYMNKFGCDGMIGGMMVDAEPRHTSLDVTWRR